MKQQLLRLHQQAKKSNLVLVAQNKQTGKIRTLHNSDDDLTLDEVPLLLSKDDEAYLLSQASPNENQEKHLNQIISECRPLGLSDEVCHEISARVQKKDIFSIPPLSLIFNHDNNKIKQALHLFSQFPKHLNADYISEPLDDQLINQTLGLIESKVISNSEQQLQEFDMTIDNIEPTYKDDTLFSLTVHIQLLLHLKSISPHSKLSVYCFENPSDWGNLKADCLEDHWSVNDYGCLTFSGKLTPKKKIPLKINIPIDTLSEKSSFRHHEDANTLTLSFKSTLSTIKETFYSDAAHCDITLSTLTEPPALHLNDAFSILNHQAIKQYFKLEGGYIGFLQTLEWIKNKAQFLIQSNQQLMPSKDVALTENKTKQVVTMSGDALLAYFLNWHNQSLSNANTFLSPTSNDAPDYHLMTHLKIESLSQSVSPLQCFSKKNKTHELTNTQKTLEKILSKDNSGYTKKSSPSSEVFEINNYPFFLDLEGQFPFDNSQNIIVLSQASSLTTLSTQESMWKNDSHYIHPVMTTLLKCIVDDYWEMMLHIIQDQLSKNTLYSSCFDRNYLSDHYIYKFSKYIHNQSKIVATLDLNDKLFNILEQFEDISPEDYDEYKNKITHILCRYRVHQKEYATVIDSILDHLTNHSHTLDQIIEVIKQNQDLRYKSYSSKATFLDFRKKHIIQSISKIAQEIHLGFPEIKKSIQILKLFDEKQFSTIKNFDTWHDNLNISALFNELGFTYNRKVRYQSLVFRQHDTNCQVYIKHQDSLIPVVLFKDLSSYELVKDKHQCLTVDIPHILEINAQPEEGLFQLPSIQDDQISITTLYHHDCSSKHGADSEVNSDQSLSHYTWYFKTTFSTMVERVFQDYIIDLKKTFEVTNPVTHPLSSDLILLIKQAEDLFYKTLSDTLSNHSNAKQKFIDIKRYLDKYSFVEKFTLSLSEKLLSNLEYKITNDGKWADYHKKGNALLISLSGIQWLKKSLSEVRLIDYQTTENNIYHRMESFTQTFLPNFLNDVFTDYEHNIQNKQEDIDLSHLNSGLLSQSIERTIKAHILQLLQQMLTEQSDQSPLSNLIKERSIEKLVHILKRFYDENWIFADYLKVRNTIQDPALTPPEKAKRTVQFIKVNASITDKFTKSICDTFQSLLESNQRFSYHPNIKITPNHTNEKTWISRRAILFYLTKIHLLTSQIRQDFNDNLLEANQLEQNLIMLYQENFNPVVSSLALENYIYFCEYEGINQKHIHEAFLQEAFSCSKSFFKDWFSSPIEDLLPKNQQAFIEQHSGSFIDYEDNQSISFAQKESGVISSFDFYEQLTKSTQQFLEFIKILEFNQIQLNDWVENPTVLDIYDQLFKKDPKDKHALLSLMQHGEIFKTAPLLEVVGNALFWGDHIEKAPISNLNWLQWYLTFSQAPINILSFISEKAKQAHTYADIETEFLSILSEHCHLNVATIKKSIASSRLFSHPFSQHLSANTSSFEIVRGKLLPAYFLSYLFSDKQTDSHIDDHSRAPLKVTNPDLSPIISNQIPTHHYSSLLNVRIVLKSIAPKLSLSDANINNALLFIPIDDNQCQLQIDNQCQRYAIMNIVGLNDIQAIRLFCDHFIFES